MFLKNLFLFFITVTLFLRFNFSFFFSAMILLVGTDLFINKIEKKKISFFFKKGGESVQSLLGMRKRNFSFFFSEIIMFLFSVLALMNLRGLLVLQKQIFLSKLSMCLLLMALSMWMFSYLPFFFSKKEKFTLFVIGEMKFPLLRYLLSNIEILTHLFRPITLTARLWVNIWVGHLIIRSISFLYFFIFNGKNTFFFPIKREIAQFFFFFFEMGIIFLQSYVFSYLVKVYFEENRDHSI